MRPVLLTAALLALAACQDAEAPTPSDAVSAPTSTSEATASSSTTAAPAGGHAEDGGHDHGSPHGGTVKEAGAGHLELVVDGRDLKVYPLDGGDGPLPVADIAGAQALVQPEGGSAQTVALAPMDDHLHGTLPEGVTAYTAVVTVPVAGETRSARFEVGLDGDFDHAH
ncbi:MAG TPA: hypothetical protein VF576_04715 [Rubricoccaceae bacterium]|jgi:hypothetical protein